VKDLVAALAAFSRLQTQKLQSVYRQRTSAGPAPGARPLTGEEQQALRQVPRQRYKFYSEEYRTRADALPKLLTALPEPRLSGLAASEAVRFIDGNRSVLEIYRAVRAEYGNVTTSSNEFKFAYVVTPESADIPLQAVVAYLRALEQAGLVEIQQR
jgi:hypothetical protein